MGKAASSKPELASTASTLWAAGGLEAGWDAGSEMERALRKEVKRNGA